MADVYLKYALSEIPRILGLVDRNPLSPTYGCFDRDYWHYKIIDFPSGMDQAYILSLALVYKNKLKNNPYFNVKRINELVIAGIAFMMKNSHNDGSCDDYYPYERALGATSFSLYAATEAYLVLGLNDDKFADFFARRGDWIIKNDEPVPLANHQAGTALALYNVFLITKDKRYLRAAKDRIRKTLSLQSPEGWFQEYGGCDPGYLTVTIDFLAKYFEKTGDTSLLRPLGNAIDFASYFLHPDGSYAGEYGSRGTYDFLPAGFEIMRRFSGAAGMMADKYSDGFKKGKQAFMNDDKTAHIFTYNFIQAFVVMTRLGRARSGKPIASERFSDKEFIKDFRHAMIVVIRKNPYYLVLSYGKGGVLKLFRRDSLILSDTGYIAKLRKGGLITNQVSAKNPLKLKQGDEIVISIDSMFYRISTKVMRTGVLVLFRMFMSAFGRISFIGKSVKKMLTKMLITGKESVPLRCHRQIKVTKSKVLVLDRIRSTKDLHLENLFLTTDLVSIQVHLTKFYQECVRNSWSDISGSLNSLEKEGEISLERSFR